MAQNKTTSILDPEYFNYTPTSIQFSNDNDEDEQDTTQATNLPLNDNSYPDPYTIYDKSPEVKEAKKEQKEEAILGERDTAVQVYYTKKKAKKSRKLMYCSICSLSCSILLLLFAFAAFYLSLMLGKFIIYNNAIIDGPKATSYDKWITNHYKGAPVQMECHNIFNLTNWEDMINTGANPIVDEVGPYCYQILVDNLDPKWTDDGDTVSFKLYTRYVWLPENSTGSQDDVFYTINGGYSGAVGTAGDEFKLTFSFGGPITAANIQFLRTQFVWDYVANRSVGHIANQQSACVNNLQTSFNESQAAARLQFCNNWSNSNTAPTNATVWNNMLLASNGSAPANITFNSCSNLFNDSVPYSLTNSDINARQLWSDIRAICGNQCAEDPRNKAIQICPKDRLPYIYPNYHSNQLTCAQLTQNVSAIFNMTLQQSTTVINWMITNYLPNQVEAAIMQQFEITTIEDLGWLQWGMGTVEPKGVKHFYDKEIFANNNNNKKKDDVFYSIPEYAIFFKRILGRDSTLSIHASKTLISGTRGLEVMTNFNYFEAALNNTAELSHYWNVTIDEAGEVDAFFADFADSTAAPTMTDKIFPAGGGLIMKRTAIEVLFYNEDPLLIYAHPQNPDACYICNVTSAHRLNETQGLSIFKTGKKDISKIAWTEQFFGQVNIPFYAEPYPVGGVNNKGQFEPFTQDDEDRSFEAWNVDYYRKVYLEKTNDIHLHGVPASRFQLPNTTCAYNETMFTLKPGFCNISAVHSNAQIFLTEPHFWAVKEYGPNATKYINKVTGVLPPDYYRDSTKIDIEQVSGLALSIQAGVQIHIWFPEDNMYKKYYPNMTTDVFVPTVVAIEYAELTPEQATLWKIGIGFLVIKLPTVSFFTFIALAVTTFIASSTCGIITFMRKRKEDSILQGSNEADSLLHNDNIQYNTIDH